MTDNLTPRVLSHDEKKAAEAAFAGRPFDPTWSERARAVYDGIVKALPAPLDIPSPPEEAAVTQDEPERKSTFPIDSDRIRRDISSPDKPASPFNIHNIKQAIEAGALIDVTPAAQRLGISFPTTITKPLWEVGITAHQTLTEEEKAARLRDVLMAFRLRLSSLVTVSPLIDFPALLAFPPSKVPLPIPLFALLQPDAEHQVTVTLLLPNEVATTIIPLN